MSDGKLKCLWDGNCDCCPEADCIATFSQASKFYVREEAECHRRYGRNLAQYRKPETQASWYRRVGKKRNQDKRKGAKKGKEEDERIRNCPSVLR